MKTMEEKAIEIAKLMEDGKGNDVTLLDISGLNSWTDYFVIVTVNFTLFFSNNSFVYSIISP